MDRGRGVTEGGGGKEVIYRTEEGRTDGRTDGCLTNN